MVGLAKNLTRKRMEPVGAVRHGRGSPKGVFAERKHHKPRLALNNFTAGVRKREDGSRTRVTGHQDEIQGVVANTLGVASQWGRWVHRVVRSFAASLENRSTTLQGALTFRQQKRTGRVHVLS
jgi:hypothetical protein